MFNFVEYLLKKGIEKIGENLFGYKDSSMIEVEDGCVSYNSGDGEYLTTATITSELEADYFLYFIGFGEKTEIK